MDHVNLGTLAQRIARNLEGWTREQPPNENVRNSWQLLAGPGGAKLHLRYDKPRLWIGGVYPRDGGAIYPSDDKERPAEITVSAQREPRAIAREIERRFLPAYLVAYRRGLEMLDKARAYQQSKKDLAVKLAQLCDVDLHSNGYTFSCRTDEASWLDVQVDGPDRVQVKVGGLDAQNAEALLRFLVAQPSRTAASTSIAPT
jgi:hypothetical protein